MQMKIKEKSIILQMNIEENPKIEDNKIPKPSKFVFIGDNRDLLKFSIKD